MLGQWKDRAFSQEIGGGESSAQEGREGEQDECKEEVVQRVGVGTGAGEVTPGVEDVKR